LQYPNGLAFDGQFLWICGYDQGNSYIVKVDVGFLPPTPPPVSFINFDLINDGLINENIHSEFDNDGNVHVVFSSYDSLNSKVEIRYATNKSGIWEMTNITENAAYPTMKVDDNNVVHIMWTAFNHIVNAYEIYYTNNTDNNGTFLNEKQLTSKSIDGLDMHILPDFDISTNGDIHFVFCDNYTICDIYYAIFSQDTTSMPLKINQISGFMGLPQIIMDASNYAHIFWSSHILGLGLLHSTNAGGNWYISFITGIGSYGFAIAKDSQDNIHFVATDYDSVKYGNNTGGNFSVKNILAKHADYCMYADLTVDENDNVHITYQSNGDSSTSFSGKGEIFYTNNELWNVGIFPQNISNKVNDNEYNPSITAVNNNEILIGWISEGFSSDKIRVATTLPDSGGYLTGKINTSDNMKDFGFVPALDSVLWSFDIYNSGIKPLTISDIVWDGVSPFIVTTDFYGQQTINWNDRLRVNITVFITAFSFPDTLTLSGNINITSDDPVEPIKSVSLNVRSAMIMGIDDKSMFIYSNELIGNYPNPFNPNTYIKYSVKSKSNVKLQIYNIKGQLIRNFIESVIIPGVYTVEWDGKNDTGNIQASGIYFYKLKIGNEFTFTKKMMLLR